MGWDWEGMEEGKPPPKPNPLAWLVGWVGVTVGFCFLAFLVGRYML